MLPEPRTDAEIGDLAAHFLGGRVYTDVDVPKDLLGMVFMPTLFGGLDNFTPEELAEITVVGVRGVDPVSPMAFNGYPIFLACQIWRRSEVIEAAKRSQTARTMIGSSS